MLPATSEAAFLGGGTYVNIHTAAFPDGAIRGQLFSGGNVSPLNGEATGTAGVANLEHLTGGAGNDSLVGTSQVNTIDGGSGADWLVGGPQNDTLNGGAGADILVWSNGDGSDLDEGGADGDTVNVNGSTTAADLFTIAANGARIDFDRTNLGPFSLDIGTVETVIVNGVGGNDSVQVADLTGVASLATLNMNGFEGDDTFFFAPAFVSGIAVNARGSAGNDTLDYTASASAVRVNLGLSTTGLSATLGGDQENPPTTHAGTGAATVSNYNVVTHTFDIAVTVSDLPPGDVIGFHIHQGAVGVNGPIIVNFPSGGDPALVPSGTGFTFNATGLVLPAASEAAFLGGGTYVNVHTALFPGGAIRGQLFSGGNATLTTQVATGAASVTGFERATGGTGNDSLVGNFGLNILMGGGGADWMVGGPGNDGLTGDLGADVLVWSNGDGSDVMEGGPDADTVLVNGSVSSGDAFAISSNGARIDFDRTNLGVFSLDIGATETLIVNGIGGSDTFTVNDLTGVASLVSQNLNGFEGDDIFNAMAFPTSAQSVRGGNGSDTLNYDARSREVSGDLMPPDGMINSPGVQGVPFLQTEFVNITNPQPTILISDATAG